uniref:G domain-containing protein n=1 Tax=Oryzias melastigma TaxID=30732 RepID=A0A3B3BCA3_ORYME
LLYFASSFTGITGVEKPWRTIIWESEKELIESIKSYKTLSNSVSHARVLLIGPVGEGKSSFFNSINSVFRGHVTYIHKYYTSFIYYNYLTATLCHSSCDTMGLETVQAEGLNLDDISNVINGHIPDHYQFNPSVPLQPEDQRFRKNPELKDKIHSSDFLFCFVFISLYLNFCLLLYLFIVLLLGIPQLVLLTKVDEACPLVKEDIKNIYKSTSIKKIAATRIGVSLSCVVLVKNYSEELELETNIDILLLSAVIQMLRFVDNYFDEISDPMSSAAIKD